MALAADDDVIVDGDAQRLSGGDMIRIAVFTAAFLTLLWTGETRSQETTAIEKRCLPDACPDVILKKRGLAGCRAKVLDLAKLVDLRAVVTARLVFHLSKTHASEFERQIWEARKVLENPNRHERMYAQLLDTEWVSGPALFTLTEDDLIRMSNADALLANVPLKQFAEFQQLSEVERNEWRSWWTRFVDSYYALKFDRCQAYKEYLELWEASMGPMPPGLTR